MYYYCYLWQRSKHYELPWLPFLYPHSLVGEFQAPSCLATSFCACVLWIHSPLNQRLSGSWTRVQTAQHLVQLDILLPPVFNSRKLVSKLSSPFWGRLQNDKLWRQQEPLPSCSMTFSMAEAKGNPHELIPVEIKAYLLPKIGEELNLIFRTCTDKNPAINLYKLFQFIV